jgi:hypothetical protein
MLKGFNLVTHTTHAKRKPNIMNPIKKNNFFNTKNHLKHSSFGFKGSRPHAENKR